MKYQAGFIGCGNMGAPVVRAIAKVIAPEEIAVTGKTPVRMQALAQELGVQATDARDIFQNSRYIFLCVKPQTMPEVFTSAAPLLAERTDDFVLISTAAGMKLDTICRLAGTEVPVIRCMPNTPVSVGEGMTTFCSNSGGRNYVSGFLELMQYAGALVPLEEELMDAGCSVAGCGPAFAAMFLEGMIGGGTQCGLSQEQALALALQTMIGTAKLIRETGISPEALQKAVCSPGGSTIEGVRVLQEGSLCSLAADAVKAAYEKNRILGSR